MKHIITPPSFELSALEPYFDAATMDFHVNKHHQGYADKLNAALDEFPDLQSSSLEELVTLDIKDYPAIHNTAGGVLNHNLFWSILSPQVDQPFPESVHQTLVKHFGAIDNFKQEFTAKASVFFGSGWTWLVADSQNNLKIISTPNQDNPLAQNLTPIIGLDLWEHSYYLKYQNRRPEYIDAFWHILNWKQVETNLQQP